VAATGKPFARYWMHNNMVSMNGEKMSKSLGNVLNIKDALKMYSPHTIRFFMLSSHYRSRLDYSDEAIKAAEQGLNRLISTIEKIKAAIGEASEVADFAAPFSPEEYRQRFEEAMNDDFNTARAIATLFDLMKAVNQYLAESVALHKPFLEEIDALFMELGNGILGIIPEEISGEDATASGELVEKLISINLDLRQEFRKQKNWAMADQVREELKKIGIILEDRPDGTTAWSKEK
jgi:cysteinyl-tRNA synthetase